MSEKAKQNAGRFIGMMMKAQMTPKYVDVLKGMLNPNKTGFNSDQTVSPFITQTDDGNYEVRIGYSSLGVFKNLNDAKKAKYNQPDLDLQTVGNKFKEDFTKAEKKAAEYVASKGKTISELPIKNQFVISNYLHTGDTNETFLDAVINNDYKKAATNYMRPRMEQANEFFKNVMFSGPVGENGFGNTEQLQNFSDNFLDQIYPDAQKQGRTKQMEKGGKMTPVAEFTGGELVNNREDEMRNAMKSGNDKKAANIFRSQVKKKNITPGKASHKSNPLPVAEDGTVMNAKGKPTGQNAKPGAGIYDHINKQYKPEMTDKEVIAMVRKNHAKWRKNGMA